MTANKNEQGSEPGRPVWAAGLDLSPELERATDEILSRQANLPFANGKRTLRRLADAEMRVAELEWELASVREHRGALQAATGMRGDPDFLIDGDGDMFRRVGAGVYWLQGGNGADWRRDELTGPVTELWK